VIWIQLSLVVAAQAQFAPVVTANEPLPPPPATVSLAVDFVKRTPINQPLRFESWVESVDGEKFSARGSCFLGDVKVSEAEALILGKYEMPVVGA